MSSLKFNIEKKHEGIKLSDYLKDEAGLSSRLIRKSLREQRVIVNREAKRARYILQEGDELIVKMGSGETQDIAPENISIDVVYEDEDILVVNKPPFMVVHPTRSHQSGTLANAVTYYFRNRGDDTIIRLVNRLDRDTSGLVVIAKSQYAHMAMAKKMISDSIEKTYIAIVEGEFEGEGTIDAPIGRPSEDSLMRCVMEDGQRAITHYKVLASNKDMSAVRVILETGRTHQIRVHMKHMGHTIIGDTLYGSESDVIGRQALHAYKLKFNTIRDNNPLELVANLPGDLETLVKHI
ncbi:RluA family pseudouridine synthase [Clostridium cylindrosporum]|uniref:Pseudouridine synthase n=1 Tax=Clostridium cylindrosporum DSM 605 TaxID=1121307 RepID=A0A0J8G4Y7_CLOCY|nr:RluA family pseudouridine synthase [Clostridium cylindrosporum]KMT22736.1 pseudouridine synthase, RluA family [Clostridium cylindrosporum DSM 605]